MQPITKNDVEGVRGEIYHMIIFAMAWVLIGEYAINFSDYALSGGIVLGIVVALALISENLYGKEDDLPDLTQPGRRRARNYALIFIFEGVAIMITWVALLRMGHETWVIPAFAGVAGLHFIPLAAVVRQGSYYVLGVWTMAVAAVGFYAMRSGVLPDYEVECLIADGCTLGAVVDAVWIVAHTYRRLRTSNL